MTQPAGCLAILLAPLLVGLVVAPLLVMTGRYDPRAVRMKRGKSVMGPLLKIFGCTAGAWLFYKIITFTKHVGDGRTR